MASDPWSIRLSSKRHPSALQSRSDLYLGFEEMDGEDDSRAEFACPFCSEDFDIVGLCCHIDDVHPVEAKSGVCPVCAARVGMNMVGHITIQHSHFFKMQRRRSRKGSAGSHSTLSLLRKELREGHIQSLLGGSSYVHSASNTAPDPLLTSFIYSFPMADASKVHNLKLQKKEIWLRKVRLRDRENVLDHLCLMGNRRRRLKSVSSFNSFCFPLFLMNTHEGDLMLCHKCGRGGRSVGYLPVVHAIFILPF